MKERTLVTTIAVLLAAAIIAGLGNTDIIYVAVTIALFAIGIAYAVGCEKL